MPSITNQQRTLQITSQVVPTEQEQPVCSGNNHVIDNLTEAGIELLLVLNRSRFRLAEVAVVIIMAGVTMIGRKTKRIVILIKEEDNEQGNRKDSSKY